MGMPALVYRGYFCGHSVKLLRRKTLGFVGIAAVHETLISLVCKLGPEGAADWAARLRKLGREAA